MNKIADNYMRTLKIATRKSALAIAQTTLVAKEIAAKNFCKYELVPMSTEGDIYLDKKLSSFGGKGVFIKELELALLNNRADIAVHSLKDMPAELLPNFKLAAVLKREDPRDVFISKNNVKFMELKTGAKIGTGSIRRIVQLKALRNDLEYVPIRGNIQTRLSKVGELDGIVLAAAGLKRLNLTERITEFFDTSKIMPASGQGILAIETLNVDNEIFKAVKNVDDLKTHCIAVAEMSYLKALNAGCQFPVASFAEFIDKTLKISGMYWVESKQQLLHAIATANFSNTTECAFDTAYALGQKLACAIKEQF